MVTGSRWSGTAVVGLHVSNGPVGSGTHRASRTFSHGAATLSLAAVPWPAEPLPSRRLEPDSPPVAGQPVSACQTPWTLGPQAVEDSPSSSRKSVTKQRSKFNDSAGLPSCGKTWPITESSQSFLDGTLPGPPAATASAAEPVPVCGHH